MQPQALEESDSALTQRFLALPQVAQAQTILLFAGMGREIDTRPMLDRLFTQGKRVLLPRCISGNRIEARVYHPTQLQRHRYGMLEPDERCAIVPTHEIELILVPALCFDRSCYRMGRGGGYYDRLLADYNGCTVGLCRDALLADAVPRQPWDRPVQQVLTETQVFTFTQDRR